MPLPIRIVHLEGEAEKNILMEQWAIQSEMLETWKY